MSTLSEKLQYCKICQNKSFNSSTGINCGLTQEKPTFEDKCKDFVINPNNSGIKY